MSAIKERGITVTIKYGQGYEESWAVFNGQTQDVRDDLLTYFGIDRASVTELTLSELVVNCTNLAHGKGNVAAMLGGTVIPAPERPAAAPVGDVWADDTPQRESAAQGATESSEDGVKKVVLAAIKAAADIPKLQRVWAENQAAFADPEVTAAYKARGRELK